MVYRYLIVLMLPFRNNSKDTSVCWAEETGRLPRHLPLSVWTTYDQYSRVSVLKLYATLFSDFCSYRLFSKYCSYHGFSKYCSYRLFSKYVFQVLFILSVLQILSYHCFSKYFHWWRFTACGLNWKSKICNPCESLLQSRDSRYSLFTSC